MRRSLGGAREKRRDGGGSEGGRAKCARERDREGEREREVVELRGKVQERGVSVEVTAENGEHRVRLASFDRGERGSPSRSFPSGANLLKEPGRILLGVKERNG